MEQPDHNPGEPEFGDHDEDAEHNPGEPEFGDAEETGNDESDEGSGESA